MGHSCQYFLSIHGRGVGRQEGIGVRFCGPPRQGGKLVFFIPQGGRKIRQGGGQGEQGGEKGEKNDALIFCKIASKKSFFNVLLPPMF